LGSEQPFVVVGAGLAGGRAVETLRQEGFGGRIILLGAEDLRPYERPPLSKAVLQGTAPDEKVFLRSVDYYAEQDIELRVGVPAKGLSIGDRSVILANDVRVRYDKLLIATGVKLRQLAAPGVELPGVFYLRTLADARRIREAMANASRVVVVGAGFIGAEVAASCRVRGIDVTLLEVLPVPLQRALGDVVGGIYAEIHRDHGVDLRLGEGVREFRGDGRLEQIVTTSGDVIDCQAAVVGVGVVPDVDWLAGSGLALANGISIDEFTRTNVPDIYAAGDVASWWHPTLGERLRVEHFENAQNQGVAAARSMLGTLEPYAPVPFFWSDQYELTLQYVGHASGRDGVVFRGDVASRKFLVFYLRDGYVRAALGINRHREVSAARKLIRDRVPVTASQLADEQVDLRRLTS
jgi:3-phenylpropionate/trans-cinnamate dioxygenase ferredoxin reductase subunit